MIFANAATWSDSVKRGRQWRVEAAVAGLLRETRTASPRGVIPTARSHRTAASALRFSLNSELQKSADSPAAGSPQVSRSSSGGAGRGEQVIFFVHLHAALKISLIFSKFGLKKFR